MSLYTTQKPLGSLLRTKESASFIVAVPSGTQPASVMTATYDAGLVAPIVSNKIGSIGVLSPVDGSDLNPSTVATPTVDSLIKVSECANCSSDLYCDSVTANVMDAEHIGACVMCGFRVSYVNSEISMTLAIENETNDCVESANFFDFSDLSTVDPNKLEENDMSTMQARKALLASVAHAMRTINEHKSDDVIIQASDDEDFATESEDEEDEGSLEVMDMDESDPADEEEDSESESEDGEDEEPEDEEASEVITDEAPVVEENTEGASELLTPPTTNPETEAVIDTPAVVEVDAVDTVVADALVEEPLVITEDAPAADANVPAIEEIVASDEVSDDTVIEYVATTPAELSPNAEIVPCGETAYYVVQDNAPVAVLRKENASAGAQALWNKPTEIRNAYRASIGGDNREAALAQLGGSILVHSAKVSKVVAERVTAQETAAATEIAAERADFVTKFRQSFEIAALGITKGLFGAAFTNPVAAELAEVLQTNGVREPTAIVRASMIHSMPSLLEIALKKALELVDASDEVRTVQAEMVGNAEFVNPVAPAVKVETVETPAITPSPEIAAITKPKIDVALLTGGLGRQARSFGR